MYVFVYTFRISIKTINFYKTLDQIIDISIIIHIHIFHV